MIVQELRKRGPCVVSSHVNHKAFLPRREPWGVATEWDGKDAAGSGHARICG
jgi:hypothetical protein